MRMNRGHVAALLVVIGLATPAAHAQQPIDVDAVARSIEQFTTRLERLRKGIDESRFEPDAMVDRLDYDADLLIDFVTNEIGFQPYAGVLRGPAGALRARAGNSLDQSLLLAYMLKSAGYDARIAAAQLNEADAQRLLQQTQNGKPPASLDYMQKTIDAVVKSSDRHATEHWPQTNLYKDAQRHERQLVATLTANGIELHATDAGKDWLPITQHYFWVQHRDGPSSPWQDAHPAFGGAPAPARAHATEFFAESVPEKYQHKFTMSAWIEQWMAGSIKTHRIMADWTRPTANLNGVALRYRNSPDGLNKDTAADLAAAIANTRLLIPTLNGAIAPGAQVFDLNGQTVDPSALGMGGAAALFQTLGDKLAAATTGVMDREDGQPALALHSMYLEFTHTDPSGHKTSSRRYLLAPREDHSGDSQALLWQLITDHIYMVATGGAPIDFVADRFLATDIHSMPLLEATVRKAFEPNVKIPVPNEPPTDLPPIAQFWLMDQRPVLDGDVVAYRAVPGLLGIRRGYRDATTQFAAVDVVWNPVEYLRVTKGGLQRLPQQAVAGGVWDTVLESVPERALLHDAAAVASTTGVFDLAAKQAIDTVVLMPGQTAALNALPLDTDAKLFAGNDLARGYAVVIPKRVPQGARMAGWWRVDTHTGETLGMTGDGYGSEFIEYVIDLASTYQGLVDALNSIKECEKEPNDVMKLCCLMEAHVNNVAGLGFGSILGETTGTAGATVFDLTNRAVEAGTGQGLMPKADAGCEKLPATDW